MADAAPGFNDVRPFFAEELRLLDRADEDAEAWERANHAVLAAIVLRYPDGVDVPEFLLHDDKRPRRW